MGVIAFIISCAGLVGATVAVISKHERDVKRGSVSTFESGPPMGELIPIERGKKARKRKKARK
jgi:hypothetical protein